jgi:hypothetical protein
MEERPKIPLDNIVAGDIIYWVCIIASMLAMIGPVVSILWPDNNIANPYKVFDLVWEGKNSEEVWAATTQEGKYPGAHFWVHHLTKGDGITQLGAWLGCVCALCAIFPAGWVFFFKRVWGYWLISMWACFMISFAMLGILEMH